VLLPPTTSKLLVPTNPLALKTVRNKKFNRVMTCNMYLKFMILVLAFSVGQWALAILVKILHNKTPFFQRKFLP
jgi:hypothetical protein